MRTTIRFYECEHHGDLSTYVEDLAKAGATIMGSRLNEDAEEGTVTIEVADKAAFLAAFRKTNSFEFSSLA